MLKIKSIKFRNHPILKNLELNFCGVNGQAVDTVIIAGENGAGKSTVLNYLYDIASGKPAVEADVVIEKDGKAIPLSYQYDNAIKGILVHLPGGSKKSPLNTDFKKMYCSGGIFSDVDINFRAADVSSVTSMALDSSDISRRSTTDLPKQIKQLLIDVQALDDAELSRAIRENPTKTKSDLKIKERMPRFTKAFARVFEGLTYDRIDNVNDNVNGHKEIIFKKNGVDMSIDGLSSGEKQVVYRGCFLLRDVNATNGAFVFIDEPEISLHPNWQMKIMDYYKGIFTGEDGNQTSQIFAVTHSPFIIHNENRRNDKVIVLARNENGEIVVKDKPEYFKCNSVEAIQDAFSIPGFTTDKPTVYLEGRTDELYFNKALEVYGLSVPFQFKWIGYIDAKGEEANTGKEALNKAVSFLISRNLPIKSVCLYDCDANKPQKETNNVVTMSLQKYKNDKGINVGIENALVFGNIDIEPYKKQRIETDGYGIEKRIPDFQKMACCNYICSLDGNTLKQVFVNLKTTIEDLEQLYT